MTIFFGFTLAESMIPEGAIMYKQVITQEQGAELIKQGVKPCLNQSQQALVNIAERLGVDITSVAVKAEELSIGDSLLVLSALSLPGPQTIEDQEEVNSAKFKFTLWTRLA
jgi:hypothetical protein